MKRIVIGLSVWVLSFFSLCAQAQVKDILRLYSTHTDARSDQYDIISIPLAFNSGVTLNFAPSSERIIQVVVDNITFLTLTANGCLSGLNQGQCSEKTLGATMIHLRRIPDLKLTGMPFTKTTNLKIITQSRQGLTKIYVFRVFKATHPGGLIYEFVDAQSKRHGDVVHDGFKNFGQF